MDEREIRLMLDTLATMRQRLVTVLCQGDGPGGAKWPPLRAAASDLASASERLREAL
jgi:hypothetical protein